MGYKLTGPLGPVYLPEDGKIVLGRRTHPKVHKDKLCSRNQTEVLVDDDIVYATPIGVNAPRLTAKTNKEEEDREALELKKGKRYVIHIGDSFTLYSNEFPFTLETCKDGEKEEKEKEEKKRKKEDSDDEGGDSDEKPKKKQKKDGDKPTCQFGYKCYRTNPDHLEDYYHPPKSKKSSNSNNKKSSDNEEGGSDDGEKKSEEHKDLKWSKVESLLILDNPDLPAATKVASFDMDDTLIKTKSGKVFASGKDDWQWKFPAVPKKLKALHKDGHRVVIFTNQAGVSTGTTKAEDIKSKIKEMSRQLGIPIVSIVATAKDKYRKPSPALWDYFVKKINGGISPTEAIFVGDAAGRSAGDGRPKKDHSASDRAFADNAGIDFKTPEEYFLGEDEAPFKYDMFDPKTLMNASTKSYDFKPFGKQELVILVGVPASGKSTFAKKKLVPKGYVHVNQDTLKKKEACVKATKQALENGDSVVVDNTNPSAEVRAEYLTFAKKMKIPARCFYFDVSLPLAFHLNKYREIITDGERSAVPNIAYNMYKNKFEIPTESEGFEEVVKIKFVAEFDKKPEEKLFYKFM